MNNAFKLDRQTWSDEPRYLFYGCDIRFANSVAGT